MGTYLYCTGLAFIFCAGIFPYFVMGRALKGANRGLAAARARALQRLRAAIMDESLEDLKAALHYAKIVELQATKDGEAVMGMVNQIIGELTRTYVRGMSDKSIFGGMHAKSIKVSGATRQELIAHIDVLEAELEDLRPRSEELERRVRELEEEKQLLAPPTCDAVRELEEGKL